jgi:hypothetical protein
VVSQLLFRSIGVVEPWLPPSQRRTVGNRDRGIATVTAVDRHLPGVDVASDATGRADPRPAAGRLPLGWVWPLLALGAGVGAVVAPLPTVLLLVVALLVASALLAPRLTAGIAVLVILFARPLEHLIPLPAMSYVDEGAVVLCVLTLPVRRLVTRQPLRTFPGQWWFTAFLVIGLLSSLLAQVPPWIFLTGGFLVSKGLLLAWAVAQLDWTERHLRAVARAGTALILVCLAATLVNLAVPDAWNAVLASDLRAVEPRSILPSLIGPFPHPIDLGQFMALSAIAVAAWRAAVGRTAFTLGLLLATAAGALLTGRRTAVTSVAAAWLWLQTVLRSTRVLIALGAVLPLAVLLLAGPVAEVTRATYHDYVANTTPEARTVLTVDSFSVAGEHFPAGAGFGRFGSAVAAENYSPEYVARGYPNIWGLGRTAEDGSFLTDTEWPAILGETGYFGAAAFACGLFAIYRAGRRLYRDAVAPLPRWAGLTLAGWVMVMLVGSVATVTFTGPPVSGAFFALAGVVTALADGTGAGGHSRSTPGAASRFRVSRTFSP